MNTIIEKNSTSHNTSSLITDGYQQQKIKTCDCSRVVDITLVVLGVLMAIVGVIVLAICTSGVVVSLGIVALVMGSLCVGIGITRFVCGATRSSLETQKLLVQQRLRSVVEEKEALASVFDINKLFLRQLSDDVKALEAKAKAAELASLEAIQKNEAELLQDIRLVLSSYTRWLDAAEQEKGVLQAALDKNQAFS